MNQKKRATFLLLIALMLGSNILVCLSAYGQPGPYNPYNPYKGQSSLYKSQTGSHKQQTDPYKSIPGHKKQVARYADDTIIIQTRPGADMDKVNEILDEVNGTVV